jgi:hypothetical protein
MNETRRTGTYVAVAFVLALLAWWASPPVEITPQELLAAKIGTPFYDNFNATEATSIRVVAFDEAKAEQKSFAVAFQNGKWTIPSHHNYPADGADRLADTATSFKGIKREELALGGDTEQSHETLGVVDPLDEEKAKLKGHGQRVTITKGDDTLVDLIIGKQVKDRPGFYYVRMPKENDTYVAKLSLNLSTKFADWIETDLLKLNRDDVKEVVIDHSSIDEVRRQLVLGEVDTLTREKTADPWKLDGVDETKEELDASKINTMLGALDDLKLVGVRPKPKGLRPDLSVDREFVKHQIELDLLQQDMAARGYIIGRNPKGDDLHLFANAGELAAATSKGVVYTLKFGEVFGGDDAEIEVGGNKPAGDKKEGDQDKEGDKPDAKGKDKEKADAGKQPSRYLFVTTHFDESYLGAAPEKPERPEGVPADESESNADGKPKISPKAPGKKAKPAPKTSGDEEPPADNEAASGGSQEESAGSAKGDDQCAPASTEDDEADSDATDANKKPAAAADDTKKKTDAPKDDAAADKEEPAVKDDDDEEKKEPADSEKKPGPEKEQKKPEDLKKEYDEKLKKYKTDLKAYEEKIEAGKKQVDELNARFNDWYYVISAENFNKLLLSRKDLVKEKKSGGDDKSKDKPADKDPFPPESKDSSDSPPDEADEADAADSPKEKKDGEEKTPAGKTESKE